LGSETPPVSLGQAKVDEAVVALVFAAMDVPRYELGSTAAYAAMARCDEMRRRLSAAQSARARAILDGVGWNCSTVH
jgi:hypothetical protein